MDLTPTISSILIQSHAPPIDSVASRRLTETLDSFLKEAYQINTSLNSLIRYLQSIRQPYLSNAPPPRQKQQHTTQQKLSHLPNSSTPTHLTDEQRTAIDTETSTLLRSLNTSITNLSTAASLQHDTTTKVLQSKYGRSTSLIFRWAAGSDSGDNDAGKSEAQLNEEGRARTTKEFRDAVLWYLSLKLERTARQQGEMVDARVERERQKRMSVLSDVGNKGVRSSIGAVDDGRLGSISETANGGTREQYGGIDLRGRDTYNPAFDGGQSAGMMGQELSPEQLQLFEEENQGLLTHFNDQLAKVTVAEKSLLEISSLQQTLLGHLSVQGEQIGSLVQDAESTGENLQKGNKELKRASERSSMAKAVFWGTVGLCGTLVVWDLIF